MIKYGQPLLLFILFFAKQYVPTKLLTSDGFKLRLSESEANMLATTSLPLLGKPVPISQDVHNLALGFITSCFGRKNVSWRPGCY